MKNMNYFVAYNNNNLNLHDVCKKYLKLA